MHQRLIATAAALAAAALALSGCTTSQTDASSASSGSPTASSPTASTPSGPAATASPSASPTTVAPALKGNSFASYFAKTAGVQWLSDDAQTPTSQTSTSADFPSSKTLFIGVTCTGTGDVKVDVLGGDGSKLDAFTVKGCPTAVGYSAAKWNQTGLRAEPTLGAGVTGASVSTAAVQGSAALDALTDASLGIVAQKSKLAVYPALSTKPFGVIDGVDYSHDLRLTPDTRSASVTIKVPKGEELAAIWSCDGPAGFTVSYSGANGTMSGRAVDPCQPGTESHTLHMNTGRKVGNSLEYTATISRSKAQATSTVHIGFGHTANAG